MFQRDAWFEACHDLSVVPREIPSQAGRKGRRHPQVDLTRGHEVKAPRHHADDFVGVVVDRDPAADDVCRAAEAALP